MSFQIVDASDPVWERMFRKLPPDRRDIFYGPAYNLLCQETLYRRHRVLCAMMDTPSGPILYPFVLRDLGEIAGPVAAGTRDMTGCYGRNGPTAAEDVRQEDLAEFHRSLARFAGQNDILCSFDRYHPVLGNERLAAPETVIRTIGNFVVATLHDDPAETEKHFRPSVQGSIRKAEKAGVTSFVSNRHVDDFLSIYEETMDRNHASDFYYFGRDYLVRSLDILQSGVLFIFAKSGDDVISCEMALIEGRFAHLFLSGTRTEALQSGANQLLRRDLMRELGKRGCRYFLLGGGVTPGDGLEANKRRFAPDSVFPSFIGGRVFDPAGLDALKQRMAAAGSLANANRFQFYDPA